MIITQLNGGIGNQMFQYAMGRNLSYFMDTELKLDISAYYTYEKKRSYSLYPLSIKQHIATEADLKRVLWPPRKMLQYPARALHALFSPETKLRYLGEKQFNYDPQIPLHKHLYLEGYWQSERYFSSIKGILRQEFHPHHISNTVGKLATTIEDKNSVSIHIRRGDYTTDPQVNAVHGLCQVAYYKRAIEKISVNVDNPYYWVFSDDPEWAVKELFPRDEQYYCVSRLGLAAYEDMYLMSCCKHHIIANSSFSWWGAWLSKHQEKTIIAPEKWFNDKSKNTADLIPPSWVKL